MGPVGAHPASRTALTPILVRGLWGRVGSTLFMQLLATSDEVVFDRVYPFEHRHLSHLLHYLEPLRGPLAALPESWMDDPDELWWMDPAAFQCSIDGDPFPFPESDVDRGDLHRRAVRGVWEAFSDSRVAALGHPARFYAEKYGAHAEVLADAGIPVRYVDLVRDPRDVWASVRAFDSARGFYGFGRREGQSEGEFLASFVRSVQRRLAAMAVTVPRPDTLLVRYEDLVSDLPGQSARLAGWLGIALDPAQVMAGQEQFRHHMTSESPQASLLRWRQELSEVEVAAFAAGLGEQLARLGYPP
ncbi:MAG: sulfotransferase [Mycobacteriales bacterium]